MTFSQRFLRFMMGVGIGLGFLAMAFGPRAFSCSYFPNARVLDEAKFKRLSLSAEANQFFADEKLDSVFLKDQLFKKSKIDFDNSKKDQTPCREYIANYTSKDRKQDYVFTFEICKETSELMSIKKK